MRRKEHMRGGEIFPPAQEFGKRSDIFQILMPTAPTRIKSLPRALPVSVLAASMPADLQISSSEY
ncbi:MAG: hypothetical protein ACLVCI_00735 [Varibaculum timonense]